MKIVRFLRDGKAEYGIVEDERIYPCHGDPFAGLTRTEETVDPSSVRLLAPVSPPNIICLGLNYRKHADESHLAYPPVPLIFLKPITALCGPGDRVVLPRSYEDSIDFESELAIVIGACAKDISEEEVPRVVLGYTIGNDVSNRAAQFKDGQWTRGKSYDTFCPLGPAIVTDLDGDNLAISCRVDGVIMQASNTSDMIFPCRQIVSFLSQCMTLLPGTVILTGTPEGVGYARKPPVFLKAGQTVECIIEGIGTLANPVSGPGPETGKAATGR
jgi:2-keto-4-pentenoate hydratase/2-oxohepta-3-ene-1,7-dioic acid hydratase in catechol pathway